MTLRTPPRAATWLLKHFGPAYRRESLAGDLFEEYQRNRTPGWYWRQTAAAVGIGVGTRLLRVRLPKILKGVLWLLIELGIVTGGIALADNTPAHRSSRPSVEQHR
jgi:hypothetical protein